MGWWRRTARRWWRRQKPCAKRRVDGGSRRERTRKFRAVSAGIVSGRRDAWVAAGNDDTRTVGNRHGMWVWAVLGGSIA